MAIIKDKNVKEIKISLLLDNLIAAREVSELFRQMDIVPAIYDNLQDLWFDILKERPTLCIVDIRLVSSGDLVLQQHPVVTSGKLNLAIYFEQVCAPLLFSASDLPNWGLINAEINLNIQIKSILNRINKYSEVSHKFKNTDNELKKLDIVVDKLSGDLQSLKRDLYYKNLAQVWIEKFKVFSSCENFYDFLNESFKSFEEVIKFSYLELSKSKQRLVCPQIPNIKFKEIPSVWLGKTMEDGIDFYGENMSSQVFLDLVGSSSFTIPIFGGKGGSEALLSVIIDDSDLIEHMCWDEVSAYLSSVYRKYLLKNDVLHSSITNELNTWDFSELVSNYYFSHFEMESEDLLKSKVLISLDFNDLIINATANNYTKFYWKKFHLDFMNLFSKKVKMEFNYTSNYSKIFFMVSKIDEDQFWSILQSYSLRFSYWKYFDETDAILAKNMKPEIKSLLISPTTLKNELAINQPNKNNFDILPALPLKSQIRSSRSELTM